MNTPNNEWKDKLCDLVCESLHISTRKDVQKVHTLGERQSEALYDELQDFIASELKAAEQRGYAAGHECEGKPASICSAHRTLQDGCGMCIEVSCGHKNREQELQAAEQRGRERLIKDITKRLEHYMLGAHTFRNNTNRDEDKGIWEHYNTQHSVWLDAMEEVAKFSVDYPKD